jgi:hypothetical protein
VGLWWFVWGCVGRAKMDFYLRWFRGLRFDVGVYRIKVMESGQGGV